jgi:hypothetical protein
VHRERSRLGVAFAESLAEGEPRRIWEFDGSRSSARRLARETRSSVERNLDRLDELRARIRWRCRNDPWYLELELDEPSTTPDGVAA